MSAVRVVGSDVTSREARRARATVEPSRRATCRTKRSICMGSAQAATQTNGRNEWTGDQWVRSWANRGDMTATSQMMIMALPSASSAPMRCIRTRPSRITAREENNRTPRAMAQDCTRRPAASSSDASMGGCPVTRNMSSGMVAAAAVNGSRSRSITPTRASIRLRGPRGHQPITARSSSLSRAGAARPTSQAVPMSQWPAARTRAPAGGFWSVSTKRMQRKTDPRPASTVNRIRAAPGDMVPRRRDCSKSNSILPSAARWRAADRMRTT